MQTFKADHKLALIILRRLLEQLLAQRVIIGDPLERLTLARA